MIDEEVEDDVGRIKFRGEETVEEEHIFLLFGSGVRGTGWVFLFWMAFGNGNNGMWLMRRI